MHLSHRITSEQDLRDLGTIGLKLDKHIIDIAICDNNTTIQGAAHEVLQRWMNMQLDGREAYLKLQAAMRKCKMNLLAEYLRKLVEGTEGASQTTKEGKKELSF